MYKNEIYHRLSKKPHLKFMETNPYSIPERVKEYNSSFFVVYNTMIRKYEIHSLVNKVNTHEMTLPFNELDCRAITAISDGDIRVHGDRIFKDIKKYNIDHDEKLKKQAKQNALDEMLEHKGVIKKLAWGEI